MTTTTAGNSYPIAITFAPPERVPRWMPFFGWLLAIPHFIVLYVLGIVAEICMVIGWFAGVITGRIPQGLLGMIAGYLRYNTRLQTYALFMRGSYPGFGLDTGAADAHTDPVVTIDVTQTDKRNRLTIFFRILLVIPHMIALFFVGIAAYVVIVIAWFAVVILGRWPSGLQNFVLGMLRWSTRVNAYAYLLTDAYPPFSME